MDPFTLTLTIIVILTPMITPLISLAEKKYGKKKGKAKKNWVIGEIVKAWNKAVASGLISGDVAKIPVALILPIAGSVIDKLISVVNDHQGVVVKKPN